MQERSSSLEVYGPGSVRWRKAPASGPRAAADGGQDRTACVCQNSVNRPDPSAHGTCTVCAPCSEHSTTGTEASRIVLNWHVSMCRHRRVRHSLMCIRP